MTSRATQLLSLAVLLASASVSVFSFPQTGATPNDQSPDHAQAPSSQTPNQSAPASNSSTSNPDASPEQTVPSNPAPATRTPATPLPKPPVLRHRKRKSSVKKGTPAKKTNGEPNKVVVRNGGEDDESAQLSPAIAPAQAQRERQSADVLLAATNSNLERVAGRQLTKDQLATLDEIHTYMRQAKAASASGDTNRAHTLAYKARLLSDELARK